jgi:hypothetical protein
MADKNDKFKQEFKDLNEKGSKFWEKLSPDEKAKKLESSKDLYDRMHWEALGHLPDGQPPKEDDENS